jgi:hypothetical protein
MLFKKLCLKAKHIIFFYLWCALIFVSTSSIAYSANYYVSPNGNASWEEASKITTPCSAQTAMQNAQAGDIVYFRGGQYELSQSEPYEGSLEPSYSGTEGNPITFANYPEEVAILNGNVDIGKDITRVLSNNRKNYIVFDGFRCQANNGSKRAMILIMGESNNATTGCVVRNCEINGGSTITTSKDNREGIRVDYANSTLIQRCKLYNFRQVDNWHNTSAIKMYANDYTIIENCEIYNTSNGIYPKQQINNCTIRYNYIHDNYYGIFAEAAGYDCSYNKTHNNVISNSEYSGIGATVSEGAVMDDLRIYNNTIYNSIRGIGYGVGRSKVWNNIIQGCANKQFTGNRAGAILDESDHNQFGTAPLTIITRLYAGDQGIYTSLSFWQNSHELEDGSNPGNVSLASDPKFVNSSGNMNQLDDFRLASDSPCKGVGRNGVDVGADISQVGPGVSPSPTGVPGAPPWFE